MSLSVRPGASVSVREVALLARVSVGTVSNVLNRPEKVAPKTVERVQEAIGELGFVRNDAARQLRAGRSRSIGVVVLDVGNPFFTDVVRGAEERAAVGGFALLLGNSDENTVREAAYLDLFQQQRVHGLLITPHGDVTARLERLRDRGIPTVLVDRQVNKDNFSSVAVDDVAGGQMAVGHLAEIGRTRIAFVGGPSSLSQVADRLEGARLAVSAHPGVTLEVIGTKALTVPQGRAAGDSIGARPAAQRPDAIFAANDLLAVGILQGLLQTGGIHVPRDIALIGYDDIAFAASSVVPLSSVRQPSELIGATAVDLLLAEASGAADFEHQQIVFQPELMVRSSTAGIG